jgi:Methyltransferase domain
MNTETFPDIARKICNDIEGWLSYEAALYTLDLLRFQINRNIKGSLLEFGVHKGCYFSVLKYAATDDNVLVGVDAFFEKLGVPLQPEWRDHAIDVILNNVRHIWGNCDNVKLVAGLTSSFAPRELLEHGGGGYKFISIDAGHDSDSVMNDLELASKLLSPSGVVGLDDFFNPVVPGVVEGYFRWASVCPPANILLPFAFCGNKLFLCSRESQKEYFEYSKKLIVSDEYRSAFEFGLELMERNLSNNFECSFFGVPYLCLTK